MTGDSSSEAESWANAARQFLMAEDQLYQARNASYQEMIEAGIQCFLLAVHVSTTYMNNCSIHNDALSTTFY